MTFIPEQEIERKAYNLLLTYSRNFNWDLSIPIPIEMIIEKQLRYTLSTFEADSMILGAIDQKNNIIYTNENASLLENKIGVYEFTLAHEVGHWDLHCDYNENQLQISNYNVSLICRDNDNDEKEIQANMYAAALLMPKTILIEKLNDVDYFNWKMLYEISNNWKVSVSALKNRLQTLDMLYYDEETKQFYPNKAAANGQTSLFN